MIHIHVIHIYIYFHSAILDLSLSIARATPNRIPGRAGGAHALRGAFGEVWGGGEEWPITFLGYGAISSLKEPFQGNLGFPRAHRKIHNWVAVKELNLDGLGLLLRGLGLKKGSFGVDPCFR